MSLEQTIAAAVLDLIAPVLAERQPAVFTLDQAAKYMHTSPRTVKQLIEQGDLPCLRVGDQYRIGRVPMDELMARGASVSFNDESEESA